MTMTWLRVANGNVRVQLVVPRSAVSLEKLWRVRPPQLATGIRSRDATMVMMGTTVMWMTSRTWKSDASEVTLEEQVLLTTRSLQILWAHVPELALVPAVALVLIPALRVWLGSAEDIADRLVVVSMVEEVCLEEVHLKEVCHWGKLVESQSGRKTLGRPPSIATICCQRGRLLSWRFLQPFYR